MFQLIGRDPFVAVWEYDIGGPVLLLKSFVYSVRTYRFSSL
jgi:hypothetical protein